MNNWLLLRHLDWARFLPVFFFVDVACLVIPAWEGALRVSGRSGGSSALEDLRDTFLNAQQELRDLVDDAAQRL